VLGWLHNYTYELSRCISSGAFCCSEVGPTKCRRIDIVASKGVPAEFEAKISATVRHQWMLWTWRLHIISMLSLRWLHMMSQKLWSTSMILQWLKNVSLSHSSQKGFFTRLQLLLSAPYGMLAVMNAFFSSKNVLQVHSWNQFSLCCDGLSGLTNLL
jgi:hypothetical protein